MRSQPQFGIAVSSAGWLDSPLQIGAWSSRTDQSCCSSTQKGASLRWINIWLGWTPPGRKLRGRPGHAGGTMVLPGSIEAWNKVQQVIRNTPAGSTLHISGYWVNCALWWRPRCKTKTQSHTPNPVTALLLICLHIFFMILSEFQQVS